jgi:ADP-heptose:LPS heptosyltransferase
VRIGFSNGLGKPLKTLWTRRFLTTSIYRAAGLDPNAPHESEVLFALGKPLLGEKHPTRDPALLRPLVIENEPDPDDRVAMQITDKWERLGIASDDVVAMTRRIAEFGGRFVASSAERDYTDEIEIAAGIRIDRFDSLEAWKNAIAEAPALVAPDSGALHVAGTIGTPVVGVFPASPQFDLQVARWSPWAAPNRIVKAEGDWPARASDALAQLL